MYFTSRPNCTKEWLLQLCAEIAPRPELRHLYVEGYQPKLNVIDLQDLDVDENHPNAYGLPKLFRILFNDTYLKLNFIWQCMVELRKEHTLHKNKSFLVDSIDGEPLHGLIFDISFNQKYVDERWEERHKYFHDLVDDVEARIAAIQPDNPIKLRRFPFAFGDWMQVIQTEDGTKSVCVCTGGRIGGDQGSWAHFVMLQPEDPTPDQPYPFDVNKRYPQEVTSDNEYTWLAGPVLAEFFLTGKIYPGTSIELMDIYVKDDRFKSGPLTETMEQIRARFDIECPDEDE